ncbi:thiamine-phosphate kinase [Bradyrhizobium sp. SYSU BS000235]|uniref:thiamine-phosphate kinase n=1 Tax=Bradyrhizobium sp. SYSU BS000235 TaxID=3411332 RepID=UPI003C759C60
MTARGHSDSGEDNLIARYFRPLATDAGALGLIDDVAILAATGQNLVVTTDAIVEGVHFLPDDPPDTIARKALRVNLSDLAAKGAAPAGFVLTLALRDAGEGWLAPFAEAIGRDAAEFGCPLLGGDTVSTPGPLMISITAFGHVPVGKMVHRSGAKAGDRVVVTGTIGDAALGLRILRGDIPRESLDAPSREQLVQRYRIPQPRNAVALVVREHASAAMDVSDGLAGDLAKLCAASGVSAAIDIPAIPLSEPARIMLAEAQVNLENIVAGGDDYEVLCTVPENRWDAFSAAALEANTLVTSIGRVVAGQVAPRFVDGDGNPIILKRLSYSHF